MVTIGEKLAFRKGIGPGFDFLRVILAAGVVLIHSFAMFRDVLWPDGMPFVWVFGYSILFLFFGLSGFLITASALRLNLPNFLINRGLRIIPALTIEVIISAFLIGPFFTNLPVRRYFESGQTFHYMTNIIGLINFQLPGVFWHNRVTIVNWSLWTIPYEFSCYALMSMLIMFRLLRFPRVIISCFVGLILVELLLNLQNAYILSLPVIIEKFVTHIFIRRGAHLIVAFIGGIALYLVRNHMPYSRIAFWLSIAFVAVVGAAGPAAWLTEAVKTSLLAVPLTYIMGFIGVSSLPAIPLFSRGDYSYGIYLYGMPVQQMMITLFPEVRDPWAQFAIAAPAIVACAAFSWHFIEKPILTLRKSFSFVARVRGVAGAGESKVGASPLEAKFDTSPSAELGAL